MEWSETGKKDRKWVGGQLFMPSGLALAIWRQAVTLPRLGGLRSQSVVAGLTVKAGRPMGGQERTV